MILFLIPALLLVAAFAVKAIYHLYLSPLARQGIPGPWYAAVSDLWSTTQQLSLRQFRGVDALLKKYGPVVRIGKNKVVFLDVQALKTVYGVTAKFDKSDFYQRFLTNHNQHSFTFIDAKDHANRKRSYAGHYSVTNLARYAPKIERVLLQMVDGLLKNGGKSTFDVMSLYRHLLVDNIFNVAFDTDVGIMERWTRNEFSPLDQAVTDFPKAQTMIELFPRPLTFLLFSIPHARLQSFLRSDVILCEAATGIFKKALAEFESSKAIESSDDEKADSENAGREVDGKSLIRRMLEFKMPDTGRRMTDLEIISEAQSHLIAGSETTSTTMSYATFELSRRPDVVFRLRQEIDSAIPDLRTMGDLTMLQNLPYLNAVIKEVLRLYPAIPGPLLRSVPAHVPDFTIAGYHIPPGTTLATQCTTLHRQKEVWGEDADEFRPERWFEETEAMRTNFIPYGLGARMCSGWNLANVMLRVLLSTLTRNFDIIAAPETTQSSLYVLESFASFPLALQAKFRFLPRTE
ncbi:cytochrome P450 [Sistotremastrum suecicum HHB10207 ss-3]|uniref:Cytochrome P450 n=1 Tax=Sistotremastrum suecicum HHB10207 ss-3 TaxID=1314776 RepID=A0A166CD72_9AGAM|nr:cytochrome P450 [Sistotremastrum suecicum HHB10207 ss-3]